MFWRRWYTLRGEVGGGWALEFPSFLGPVKWHRTDRRVPFGAQKTQLVVCVGGRGGRGGALELGGGKGNRGWFSYLKVHKREKFFGSDFEFFTIL